MSESYNLIPVFKSVLADMDTVLSCYLKIKKNYPESPSFILESVESQERIGRYSFIGFDPFLTFKSKGKKVFLSGVKNEEKQTENPFHELKSLMGEFKTPQDIPLLRFYGGAIGHIGYDMVRFFEKLPEKNQNQLESYDSYFIFPKKILAFDHFTHKITLIQICYLQNQSDASKEYDEALKEIARLETVLKTQVDYPQEKEFSSTEMVSSCTKEEFEGMVVRAKEYIQNGDIIQVVLSQRLKMATNASGISLYRALRVVNPSPYLFFLEFPEYSLIGSSPEILVRLENNEIEVRPIAGTRKRGKNDEEDKLFAEELLEDEKERAEHVMLVDLGRNDVGRVSETGSVRVTDLMIVEKYSHVMHIVSSVKGVLKSGKDAFDVFEATFPAGTLSGAPKIRAMEIIEELEKEKRETYGGGVGYFGYNGNMDFCIAIRTMFKKGNEVFIQAGAGIVADSSPESEYQETLNKAGAALKAVKELNQILG
ncbi:MAG TPA: anthranilate synthase component I [Spirochaetia bacterium]|nr:MAG: anthranilate synthase component I [Spirochaetes bacterium GWB1_36_13]HCL56169.1 anthranilate synthase component I [Spirochaetia bacterium]